MDRGVAPLVRSSQGLARGSSDSRKAVPRRLTSTAAATPCVVRCAGKPGRRHPPVLLLNAASETPARIAVTRRRSGRAVLFFAFAFAVMADPVSSVAYTIEAALRALDGQLGLLLPAMVLVLGVIALVTSTTGIWSRRFPQGGGSPRRPARAFGDGWAFVPIGALIVDFVLTIAISIAAAVQRAHRLRPGLAPIPAAARAGPAAAGGRR